MAAIEDDNELHHACRTEIFDRAQEAPHVGLEEVN